MYHRYPINIYIYALCGSGDGDGVLDSHKLLFFFDTSHKLLVQSFKDMDINGLKLPKNECRKINLLIL